jgi:hypothetical protein
MSIPVRQLLDIPQLCVCIVLPCYICSFKCQNKRIFFAQKNFSNEMNALKIRCHAPTTRVSSLFHFPKRGRSSFSHSVYTDTGMYPSQNA